MKYKEPKIRGTFQRYNNIYYHRLEALFPEAILQSSITNKRAMLVSWLLFVPSAIN